MALCSLLHVEPKHLLFWTGLIAQESRITAFDERNRDVCIRLGKCHVIISIYACENVLITFVDSSAKPELPLHVLVEKKFLLFQAVCFSFYCCSIKGCSQKRWTQSSSSNNWTTYFYISVSHILVPFGQHGCAILQYFSLQTLLMRVDSILKDPIDICAVLLSCFNKKTIWTAESFIDQYKICSKPFWFFVFDVFVTLANNTYLRQMIFVWKC